MTFDALWPWRWNAQRPAVERLAWLTDVRQTGRGKENRTRIREHPRRGAQFQAVIHGAAARRFDARMWEVGTKTWLLPMWWDAAKPTSFAISVGGGSGGVDVYQWSGPGIGQWREWSQGGYVVAIRGDTAEAYEVLDFTDDTVQTADEVDSALGSGAVIYPAWPAALQSVQPVDREGPEVLVVEVSFELIDYRSPDGLALPQQYDGADVLTDRPDSSGERSTEYERQVEVVDFETGAITRYDDSSRPFLTRSPLYLWRDKQRAWERRRWFQRLGGAHRSFGAPTYHRDLEVVGLTPDGLELQVERDGQVEAYDDELGRSHVYLRVRGESTAYIREVEFFADEEDYTIAQLTEALPSFDPADVIQCSWLEKVRLAGDVVEISWLTSHVAEASLGLRGIDADL